MWSHIYGVYLVVQMQLVVCVLVALVMLHVPLRVRLLNLVAQLLGSVGYVHHWTSELGSATIMYQSGMWVVTLTSSMQYYRNGQKHHRVVYERATLHPSDFDYMSKLMSSSFYRCDPDTVALHYTLVQDVPANVPDSRSLLQTQGRVE